MYLVICDGNKERELLIINQAGHCSFKINSKSQYVTSTTDSQSVISYSTFCNQHTSAKSIDGKDPSDVRCQQFIQGMKCRQLSVASNSNGFHEEMSSQKMSDHLLK